MGAGPGESYLQPESVWEQFGVHCAAVSPPFPKCQLLGRRENCMSLTWMLLCSSLVLETFFYPVEQQASALELSCTPAVIAHTLTCQSFCICYFFMSAFAHII